MPRIELASGVASLPREDWNALAGEASPFLRWEWLASLEDAGCVGGDTGWEARPLLLREDGRLVGACPLYVKAHSEGEFVFDWAWADAAERAGIRYYPKLLVGVPFTPVGSPRLLVAAGEDAAAQRARLAAALRELCADRGFSGAHVDFCTREEAAALGAAGFLERVGIQYHWHDEGYASFEDYLSRLRSKRRNQIRRERREIARQGVRIEVHAGEKIDEALFESMYRFYRATVHRHVWGRQYLNRAFFERLAERFREQLVFVVARRGDRPIAGAFNVAGSDALYGRYWGATEAVRHLHFEVCYYAGIEYCIEHGLSRFEPGAGGEYKQVRGFDARPTWSAHRLADPRLHHAVARFLEGERAQAGEALDWLHAHSALKPAAS